MKKKETTEEVIQDEQDEKEEKKSKRREGVEKRKKAKKIDKITRWSGFILLLVIVLVGFLLWVAGEMRVG